MIKELLIIWSLLTLSNSAHAATIQALSFGWNTSTEAYIGSYYVSKDTTNHYDEHRNWFLFDTSNIGEVNSATLRVYNIGTSTRQGFSSNNLYETWSLFDVSADNTTQIQRNNTTNPSFYTDIGSGLTYGSTNVSSDDNGMFVEVDLNASALSRLSSSSLYNRFAIGGGITTEMAPIDGNASIFGFSYLDARVELVISEVPLPASAWLFSSGILGLAGLARIKRKEKERN